MRILIFTDNHYCESSSIVRGQGQIYSKRIENQLQTMNWVETTAMDNGCDLVVSLGDFFDKPVLSDIEITSLKEIKWNKLPHYFIVGNHESSVNGLKYNSTNALKRKNFEIVNTPQTLDCENSHIHFLPYVIEADRKSLSEYFDFTQSGKHIVLSHNDIKGIQMGAFLSKDGFSIDEIEESCDLFLNGHLHNTSQVSKKMLNVGNITGMNFGEDAFRYKHQAIILDTNTCQYTSLENPYAFNFYKIEIMSEGDLNVFSKLKTNCVLSVSCREDLREKLDSRLEVYKDSIVEVRKIFNKVTIDNIEVTLIEDFSIDHLEKFKEFCLDKIENSDILYGEIMEVCR